MGARKQQETNRNGGFTHCLTKKEDDLYRITIKNWCFDRHLGFKRNIRAPSYFKVGCCSGYLYVSVNPLLETLKQSGSSMTPWAFLFLQTHLTNLN